MERKVSTDCFWFAEGDRVTLFECCRTQVAKSRVSTTQIVEAFDVEKDVVARGLAQTSVKSTHLCQSVIQTA